MAVKKSELYSTLWNACNKLRGGVEPARYKDYVLVLLFFKYISDKNKGHGSRAMFKIGESYSFDDLIAAKNDKNVGELTDTIIGKFLEKNGLEGYLPEVRFNNSNELGEGKELVDKVSGLIAAFQNPALDFKNNRASGDDIIGDAYEYFMMKFAQESGKSKGQFYTPSEVSRIIARLIGISEVKVTPTKTNFTIYDPACGSGSLLIRSADEAPINSAGNSLVSVYGQEKDNSTSGLAIMNLFLHGWDTAEIRKGNTLVNPAFTVSNGTELDTFDFVVMNPPFSDKSWSDGINISNDKFKRFEDGEPPEKNGDFAWFLHVLKSLNDTGKAGIIMPHGILFRGNAEETIRKNILAKKFIKGIVSLPANLFYGTGIPACIVIIDKENAETRNEIFMIDASRDFKKDGNKNRLREQDIEKIVQTFLHKKEIKGYSRSVPYSEILKDNDGNLNVPRYIQKIDDTLPQNIAAHLFGGIPANDVDSLVKLWTISPQLKEKIFVHSNEKYKIYDFALSPAEIENIVVTDENIKSAKINEVEKLFEIWKDFAKNILLNVDENTNPKDLIRKISLELLEIYEPAAMLDNYAVYDCLLNYWLEVLQDDIYAIKSDGYETAGRTIQYAKKKKKDKSGNETEVDDLTKFTGETIPKEIIESEYFSDELQALNLLVDKSAEMDSELEEMREENSGDDGLFAEVLSDTGTISKDVLKRRINELTRKNIFDDEYTALKKYFAILEEKSKIDKNIKTARAALDKKIIAKYPVLTVPEIKHLLFDLKWTAKIKSDICNEFEQILNALSARFVLLAKRYEHNLGNLENNSAAAKAAVINSLERMGFSL